MKSVLLAMSGGVDSSVAALLLQKAGYVVVGVTFRMWEEAEEHGAEKKDNAIYRAQSVCRQLNIEHFVEDLRKPFRSKVVDRFMADYIEGRTPNPCWHCNRVIKWASLMATADRRGLDLVSTGHYARIIDLDGKKTLKMGICKEKDQSYYLSNLTQKELAKTILPLGEFTKSQVRTLAARNHLATADVKDSQDLCFLSDSDYRKFLREHSTRSIMGGDIVDPSGRILGKHTGLIDYTIGQRKGIRIPEKERLFVIGKEVSTNTLIVAPGTAMGVVEFTIRNVNQLIDLEKKQYEVKIRYRSRLMAARVTENDEHWTITLERPARDVSPGQVAVIYDGDLVVASGVICDL